MTQELIDEIVAIREKGNAREDWEYSRLQQIHSSFGLQPPYRGTRCGGCVKKAFEQLDELIADFNAKKIIIPIENGKENEQ